QIYYFGLEVDVIWERLVYVGIRITTKKAFIRDGTLPSLKTCLLSLITLGTALGTTMLGY
ncbi:hypothetical protein RYX45_22815, partial [Alkalihalophilus pseudofirmus]